VKHQQTQAERQCKGEEKERRNKNYSSSAIAKLGEIKEGMRTTHPKVDGKLKEMKEARTPGQEQLEEKMRSGQVRCPSRKHDGQYGPPATGNV
jgi:hypothetical protein